MPGDWAAASPRASSSSSTSTGRPSSRTRSCPAKRRPGVAPARRRVVHGDAQARTARSAAGRRPADAGHPHPGLSDPRDAPQGQDRRDIDHPAVFPVALPEFVIEAFSRMRATSCFEPFGGSGTTMLAAERTGRVCRGVEIAPNTWMSPSGASSRTIPACRSRRWRPARPSSRSAETRRPMGGMTASGRPTTSSNGRPASWCPMPATRAHSAEQVAQIATRLPSSGSPTRSWRAAIGVIVAGHGRLLLPRNLGLEPVPVVVLDHLSADPAPLAWSSRQPHRRERRAGTTRCCGSNWKPAGRDGFDLDITGFDADALAELMAGDEPTGEGRPTRMRCPRSAETPVSRPGDVWIWGHRLLCGDATVGGSATSG